MIPDYQSLMRPVLEEASNGEVRIRDVVQNIGDKLGLTEDERAELLPSGKQSRFSNRVHWARTYLKQAGLLRATKRGHIAITQRGTQALADQDAIIDRNYLEQFEEFQAFQQRKGNEGDASSDIDDVNDASTPDEAIRAAHRKLNAAIAAELVDRVRNGSPAFFESIIVQLLLAMGYGGTAEDAGQALGRAGDDGVDGVIDQDPLGVDQIYVQAKRYAEGNSIGSGAIRDFFGALNLKRAHKGIFFTTSSFTSSAQDTAANLGSRIVLIDGKQLARLMLRYNIGCRDEEILHIKRIDEEFFDES